MVAMPDLLSATALGPYALLGHVFRGGPLSGPPTGRSARPAASPFGMRRARRQCLAECEDIVAMRNVARSYWRRGPSRLPLVKHARIWRK
jgi:hypothetical protein